MAEKFLIDTSTVIKYLNGTIAVNGLSFMDDIINNERIISFITEIELQSWNPPNPEDTKIYQLFVDSSNVIGINNSLIQETIKIRKFIKLKLPDALIAATAITNDMTLIADNDKDFKLVTDLKYINPNKLGAKYQ